MVFINDRKKASKEENLRRLHEIQIPVATDKALSEHSPVCSLALSTVAFAAQRQGGVAATVTVQPTKPKIV